ncbi:hypothetical protein O6H91_Y111700 [Diphasiastrum complanatum]|nr:hypothetical protein O6H91_Y111700 [Diphasiastrum complanatum]
MAFLLSSLVSQVFSEQGAHPRAGAIRGGMLFHGLSCTLFPRTSDGGLPIPRCDEGPSCRLEKTYPVLEFQSKACLRAFNRALQSHFFATTLHFLLIPCPGRIFAMFHLLSIRATVYLHHTHNHLLVRLSTSVGRLSTFL